MSSPEFIYFNGQAARVTSLSPSEEPGGFTLVVIARGGADRDQMLELLNAEELNVRLNTEPERPMRTADIDVRSVGNGPQAIHRIQAVLIPLDASLPEPVAPIPLSEPESVSESEPEHELTSIEQRLDRIIELLTEIRDRI